MPRFETPRMQMAVFQMVIKVASGLSPGGENYQNSSLGIRFSLDNLI